VEAPPLPVRTLLLCGLVVSYTVDVAAVTSFEFAGVTAAGVATACRTDPATLEFVNDVVSMSMMCAVGGTKLLTLLSELELVGAVGLRGVSVGVGTSESVLASPGSASTPTTARAFSPVATLVVDALALAPLAAGAIALEVGALLIGDRPMATRLEAGELEGEWNEPAGSSAVEAN
jgi:hypothetical protein